jgi:hypothetical protein
MSKSRTVSTVLLTVIVCAVPTVTRAQQAQRPYLYRETWYETLLKSFNPTNFDYGRWFEARRQAFLNATVSQPQFWYSLWVTVLCLFLVVCLWKRIIDGRRQLKTVTAMMADVYNHDLYSRQLTKKAISRHNRHIETCNRAFEASEAGDGRLGWGETHTESLKAELQRVTGQLEAATQERNKLQEELRQKSVIVSDLSLRIDAVSKKVNGGARSSATEELAAPHGKENGTVVVDHINRLQEELYAERQKNKRLKG